MIITIRMQIVKQNQGLIFGKAPPLLKVEGPDGSLKFYTNSKHCVKLNIMYGLYFNAHTCTLYMYRTFPQRSQHLTSERWQRKVVTSAA